jgi:hypothetical protein
LLAPNRNHLVLGQSTATDEQEMSKVGMSSIEIERPRHEAGARQRNPVRGFGGNAGSRVRIFTPRVQGCSARRAFSNPRCRAASDVASITGPLSEQAPFHSQINGLSFRHGSGSFSASSKNLREIGVLRVVRRVALFYERAPDLAQTILCTGSDVLRPYSGKPYSRRALWSPQEL